MTAQQKLEALYRSEINFEITTFFDMGWIIRLGDSQNGWKEDDGFGYDSLEQAAAALWSMAKVHYPDAACFKTTKLSAGRQFGKSYELKTAPMCGKCKNNIYQCTCGT